MELNIYNMGTISNKPANALHSTFEKTHSDEERKKFFTHRQKIEVELRDLLDEEDLQGLSNANLHIKAQSISLDKEELDKIALSYFYINGKQSMYLLFISLKYDEIGICGCDLSKAEYILKSYYADKFNLSIDVAFNSIFGYTKFEKAYYDAMYRFFNDIVSLKDYDSFEFLKREIIHYINSHKRMKNYFKSKNRILNK